jgi:hypothetical protein
MFKRGSKVWVCYDGKWSRRVEGTVVATHRGKAVTVRFQQWDEPDVTLTHKFRVTKRNRVWGGPSKQIAGCVPTKDSLMSKLFDLPGDWYRVFKYKDHNVY